jgi:hypothetical protein
MFLHREFIIICQSISISLHSNGSHTLIFFVLKNEKENFEKDFYKGINPNCQLHVSHSDTAMSTGYSTIAGAYLLVCFFVNNKLPFPGDMKSVLAILPILAAIGLTIAVVFTVLIFLPATFMRWMNWNVRELFEVQSGGRLKSYFKRIDQTGAYSGATTVLINNETTCDGAISALAYAACRVPISTFNQFIQAP